MNKTKINQGYMDAIALHKERGFQAVEARRAYYLTGGEGSNQHWFAGFNQAYKDLKNKVYVWANT